MESPVKSAHLECTPVHGEADLTVKKYPRLSKHHAHATKPASMHQQKRIVFSGSPLSFHEVSCKTQHPMHTPIHIRICQKRSIDENQTIFPLYIRVAEGWLLIFWIPIARLEVMHRRQVKSTRVTKLSKYQSSTFQQNFHKSVYFELMEIAGNSSW